jgi:hypothetical protein
LLLKGLMPDRRSVRGFAKAAEMAVLDDCHPVN